MTEPTTAVAALTAVMADVQGISKAQRVTSGPAQFNFRGVDAVVNVVGPVLRKHGVVVVPHSVEEIREERYETSNKKQMHGVILRIVWRFYGPDGSYVEASSVGESADSGDKASPKAHSVAYRTVLLQALCIPTDEPDPDSQVHERAAEPAGPVRDDALVKIWLDDFSSRVMVTEDVNGQLRGVLYKELTARANAGFINQAEFQELQGILKDRVTALEPAP